MFAKKDVISETIFLVYPLKNIVYCIRASAIKFTKFNPKDFDNPKIVDHTVTDAIAQFYITRNIILKVMSKMLNSPDRWVRENENSSVFVTTTSVVRIVISTDSMQIMQTPLNPEEESLINTMKDSEITPEQFVSLVDEGLKLEKL